MTISRIIAGREHDIITCVAQDDVRDAARVLAEKRIGALPVMEGNMVVGIFSERDLLYCIARDGAEALDGKVGDMMTAPAITIDPASDALEALSLMTRRRVRHLPVVDENGLVGFVSIGDLVKFRIDQVESEAQQMREYVTAA